MLLKPNRILTLLRWPNGSLTRYRHGGLVLLLGVSLYLLSVLINGVGAVEPQHADSLRETTERVNRFLDAMDADWLSRLHRERERLAQQALLEQERLERIRSWTTQAGGEDSDYANALALLPDGSALVAGGFNETATFGSTTLTSAGSWDAYIAKLNTNGSLAWATQAGGADYVSATVLSVLPDGSVLVAGLFYGTATFGSTTLTAAGVYDAYIAKLNADGSFAWATQAGGEINDYANALSVLPDGSVLVAGRFYKTATFGSTTLTSAGDSDAYIAKLNTDGRFAWATQAGGTSYDSATALSVLPDGSALVAGRFEGRATFGRTTLTSAGKSDAYIAKLNADGRFAWATQAGGTSYDSATALSVLPDGSVLVAGRFYKTATFDSTTLTSAGNSDAYIAKLNADGRFAWATQAGGTNYDSATALSVLPDGSSLVAGRFKGRATFGRTTLTSAGVYDAYIYIAKLNADGRFAWVTPAGGIIWRRSTSLSVLPDGSSLVAGNFEGTATFGRTTLTSAGDTDIFITKLKPNGTWSDLASKPLRK